MKPVATAAVAVFIATALFWLPSTRYEFLADDDPEYVVENEHVRGGLTSANALWAFDCGYAANWHPLAWLSLMADVSVAGGNGQDARGPRTTGGAWTLDASRVTFVMHLHNVLLHAVVALLLFLLLDFLAPGHLAANALLVLLWAVHPLRCEVTCWISERKELLSVAFMMASVLAYVGRFGTGSPYGYAAALAFQALALMAKPVAVSLPLVFFAWDWAVCGRRFSRCVLRTAPFAVLAAAASVLTLVAQTRGGAMSSAVFMPYAGRVSSALKAPLVYLIQTACPVGLSARYPLEREWQWGWSIAGMAFLLALAFVVVRWWRTRSPLWGAATFGIAWCYGGLIPMLGIVKVGTQPHSDRYTYWVGCGLCAAVALGIRAAGRRWPGICAAAARSRATWLFALAAVGAYGLAGSFRMKVWRDDETYSRDAYAKSGFFDMGNSLAHRLFLTGREAEGEAVLRDAVSRAGEARDAAKGYLARYLAAKERPSADDMWEVGFLARSALAADPQNEKAHEALGLAAYRQGNLVEARVHLAAAVESGARDGSAARLLETVEKRLSEEGAGHVQ